MGKKRMLGLETGFLLVALLSFVFVMPLKAESKKTSLADIETMVDSMMREGKIPGLSLAIVREGEIHTYGFGRADAVGKIPVTAETLFELASCSKAFTALGLLELEKEGLVRLDDPLSRHLPELHFTYKGKPCEITLRQLLHHTSGIPQDSIALIDEDTSADALQKTVRKLAGYRLRHQPGAVFEYATLNYDIVGALIEKLSGRPFETYMAERVFSPLGLRHTRFRGETDPADLSAGFKISFSSPRLYRAPLYRGNNPAGYIVSDARDLAVWLQWQIGLRQGELSPLIDATHRPDMSVPPSRADNSIYAMGWKDYFNKNDILDHSGNNPNFSSYVSFSVREKVGVAVLTNANSTHTNFIGYAVMNALRGVVQPAFKIPHDEIDRTSSLVSLILGLYMLGLCAFAASIMRDLAKKRRKFEGLGLKKIGRLFFDLLLFLPFVLGVFFIPQSLANMPLHLAMVWSPVSFKVMFVLLLVTLGASYLCLLFSSLFPVQNKYSRSAPLLVMLSLLAGGANAVIIFLVSRSIFSDVKLFFQLYNFALAFGIYIVGRKYLQTRLIRLTFDIIYDLRMKLTDKILLTSYQKYEKLGQGRIFATLNDDTAQIGTTANIFVQLITSIITAGGAFIYLATIAFWATAVALFLVLLISTLYYFVSRRAHRLLEEARDSRNVYMGLLHDMIGGYKELSLQYKKKMEFKDDVADSVDLFRRKTARSMVAFLNAFLIGESMLIVVLGMVGFGIPRFFPDVSALVLTSFIMVLLYLIGPINGILNSIPALIQLKIAWDRVKGFVKDIPANLDRQELERLDHARPKAVESIKARGVVFEYETTADREKFSIGPLDFAAAKGDVIFVIGGNGSGKTTLAKLLTGLYIPKEGKLEIDGRDVGHHRLGEYFSTVFSDYHLFKKIYNVDLADREEETGGLLTLLQLQDKVLIENNTYSTLDLSGGQRKRLALLQCYLENAPIFLFDEVAADQDPLFRRFFYRELLPEMKRQGKIVIAITHDDHYFDLADQIIKMDMGRIDMVESGEDYRIANMARTLEIGDKPKTQN